MPDGPAESAQWPERVEPTYTTAYSDDGYRLHPTEHEFVAVPAPEDEPQAADRVVSATAAIVTLTARCRDLTGAPVELTLAVNGETVLTHEPTAVLGPGYAGLHAMPFSDVDGAMITAEYQQFELRRGHG